MHLNQEGKSLILLKEALNQYNPASGVSVFRHTGSKLLEIRQDSCEILPLPDEKYPRPAIWLIESALP